MISLKEMAVNLKANVLCVTPDEYAISDELRSLFSDTDIRGGVRSFAALLNQLFDVLIANDDSSAHHADGSVNSKGHTNIYADLRNPLALLYCIGLHGIYDADCGCLRIDGNELNNMYKKVRGNKSAQYLRLLQDSGLCFSAEVTSMSFNLNKAGVFEIHYPDDKSAIIGLKVIAEATIRTGGDILYTFARCDYHALALPEKYNYEIRDVTKFLPDEYRSFFIELHDYLMSEKCTCESKNNMNEYIFSYNSKVKKAKIFSIHVSMDNSYVKLNSKLIRERPSLLDSAPESVRDAVKKGWTCAKKNDPNACNPRCVGKNLRFTMDGTEYLKCWILNFNLPVDENTEREYIREWLEKELT